jgi:hypothetical protein
MPTEPTLPPCKCHQVSSDLSRLEYLPEENPAQHLSRQIQRNTKMERLKLVTALSWFSRHCSRCFLLQ